MCKVLVEGGTETFINHTKVHKTIMADCNVKEEAVASRSLILTNKCEIAALTVADPAANNVKVDNLVEANRKLTETGFARQKDKFYYFEKLLSSALAVEW